MASGLENRIGYGQAQILSQEGFQPMQFAEMYRQTKDRDEQKRLYEEQKKEQDEYKKIQIIGDALDPRNFNVHVHTRVKDAIGELAKRNRDEGMSLADTFLAAQQYAGKLGYMSDQFNQLQQQLAATRESYKPYKEINTNEISKLALSKALVEFDKNGGIDLTKNYFDEALNENPDAALIGGNGYVPDVVKDELVPYESEGQERDARGGGSIFKYKFDNVPAFYDVKTRGRFDAPEVTTRGQKINIGGQDVMMLDDIAWARYQVSPVNTLRLRKRLKEKYGSALTPQNEETLARIEAYNDVDRFKPQPRITDRQFEPRATNINITNNTGTTPRSVTDMGNEFDLIDLGVVKKSFWSGKETIPSNAITANAKAALKAYGLDLKDINEFRIDRNTDGTIKNLIPIFTDKDGKVTGEGSPISRTAMRNAQLKFNSERAKDEQLSFGVDKNNNAAKQTYEIKGRVYSEKELLDMGYTLDQIKSYKK
jgi:hypothetical protein